MQKDPEKSIDAILDNDSTVDGFKVHKLSLGRYAILELLESPFINTEKEFSVLTVLPTIYAMTLPIEEISKYNKSNISELIAKSFVWSEENDIRSLDKFINVILEKFGIVNNAAPTASSNSDDGKKKVQD